MPREQPNLAVAVDLGGTRFRVAIVDRRGRLVERVSHPTEAADGRDAVIARVLDAVRTTVTAARVRRPAGLGVGVPGPVNPWTGVVASAPNLPGWRDVPFKQILEAALDLPVHVGNDANLAALGEHAYGAGRGDDDLIYLTVSTGIGGGIIADGRLVLGTAGLAGEPGHMTILPDGPACNCGNHGCLEVLASGTAIGREARRRIAAGEATALAQQPIDTVDAAAVARAAQAGDPLAADVFGAAMAYLGIGVASLFHLFNPRSVIIGGGVANAGDLLFLPVREAVRRRCMPAYRHDTRIVPAKLGDDVGLLGAAALAFRPAWQVR